VTISKSVVSIGAGAFYECENLININYCGTIEEWNAIEKGYGWYKDTSDMININYNYR
jgi:hypothetical protein